MGFSLVTAIRLKDPKGKMKENLIGKLIQGINITKPLDAKENRRIANELKNDRAFEKALDGGNYLNLYNKTKSTPQELAQEFSGIVQKHMQPVKEQHQPERDIQKANEIQQNVLSSL